MPRGAFFRGVKNSLNNNPIYMSLETYIKETKGELKHVTWPNKQQTIDFTLVVIFLSVFVGVMLGFFDFIFTSLLKMFVI